MVLKFCLETKWKKKRKAAEKIVQRNKKKKYVIKIKK